MTVDNGPTEDPRSRPCPVCEGMGGWSRNTYEPVGPASGAFHRCLYCGGKGRVVLPSWIRAQKP